MNRIPALALSAILCAAAAVPSRAGAFERKPFDRSRFAAAEAAGKEAVAAAATQAPATSAPAAPAEPSPVLREFFGEDLLTDKGDKADLAGLDGKILAIYFSASWCPPCRAFTPLLVDIADKLRAAGKPFELVLVGCDQTREKAFDYMSSHGMKGYLVPPGAPANDKLSERYRVRGIPYLVVVDSTGRTLDPSARATVQSSGGDAEAVWSRWSP